MNETDPFARNRRPCPRCGDLVLTLGTTCPSCGRRFERRGVADFLPDLDWMADVPFGLATLALGAGAVVALIILAISRLG